VLICSFAWFCHKTDQVIGVAEKEEFLFFSPASKELLFQPDLFFYLSQDTAATMTKQKQVAKAKAA